MTTYQPKNQLGQEGRDDSLDRMYRMFVEEYLPQLQSEIQLEQENVPKVQYELTRFYSLAGEWEQKTLQKVQDEMTRFYSLAQKVTQEKKIKPRTVRITLPLGSGQYWMPEHRSIECRV